MLKVFALSFSRALQSFVSLLLACRSIHNRKEMCLFFTSFFPPGYAEDILRSIWILFQESMKTKPSFWIWFSYDQRKKHNVKNEFYCQKSIDSLIERKGIVKVSPKLMLNVIIDSMNYCDYHRQGLVGKFFFISNRII